MITTKIVGTRTVSDRLIEDGASDVSDAELLSTFLIAKNGVSPIERARAILEGYSLIELIRKPHSKELRALGVSKRQLTQIHAGMELAKRSVAKTLSKTNALSCPQDVRDYLALQITGFEEERFSVLYVDNRHRPLAFETLFYGDISSAAVYPRVVVKRCLSINCAGVFFVHNHPNGVSAEPSDTDVRLTRKLVDALNTVDIRAMDHFVYAQGVYVSLAERGLM